MDKLDIYGHKPLHHLNRFRLIVELRETRAELRDARQQIKDLRGAIDTMITAGRIRNVIKKTKL